MKTRHKFPATTDGVYRPGVGYTITRANIARVRNSFAAAKAAPPTHAQILHHLLLGHEAENRHASRVVFLARQGAI